MATPSVLPSAERASSPAHGLHVGSGWLDMAYQQRNVLWAKRIDGGSSPIPTLSTRLKIVVRIPTDSVMPASVAPRAHPACP